MVVLLGPPLFSTDIFSYQAYARMFAHLPHEPVPPRAERDLSCDPLYHYIGAKWINTPSVYGPLFTFISGDLRSRRRSPSASFAFKLIAALASAGTMYFDLAGAKLRGLNPVRGIALFGLNPLVTLYGVGGGHNDLLMLLLTTAGVYAVLSRREGARRRADHGGRRDQADRRARAAVRAAVGGATGRGSAPPPRVADRRRRPPRSSWPRSASPSSAPGSCT